MEGGGIPVKRLPSSEAVNISSQKSKADVENIGPDTELLTPVLFPDP